jgi:predicted RND superfamily exporter protein
LNENSTHELSSSTQKVKPSKLKGPSNAFQSRYRPCSSEDAIEIKKVLVTEQALTEIMAQTLKHAASSMFVTSFTTAAAFCTNMLTNISFVQVFGVFTGTCILLYFVITVTAIAAFAVSSS